jgi:hypothetical protein
VPRADLYSQSVFINCPFSSDYQPIFRAILFAVYACGYRPRCALEISDSSQNRLSKIQDTIAQSGLGIHDISFTKIDKKTNLPRFNMPFEAGIFLAAKRFGAGKQKLKVALILDEKAYRYRDILSDISGQDIAVHNGIAKTAIRQVRDWLDSCQGGKYSLPGGGYINKQYLKFSRNLPAASKNLKLKASELTYPDTCRAIEAWLKDNA